MNLRISEGQIRFRITREELVKLLLGDDIGVSLPISKNISHYTIKVEALAVPLRLEENNDELKMLVDRRTLEDFEKQLPSRDGIEHEIILADGTLKLMLEVDVRKSPKH